MNNKSKFEILFGLKESEISENCLLMPIIPKFLFKKKSLHNIAVGKLYSTIKRSQYTLIHTRVGAGFVGDAVLYLKNTSCKRIILLGSCGVLKDKQGLSLGSFIIPEKSYSFESFSGFLLHNDLHPESYTPDETYKNAFIESIQTKINTGICATIASLKLEEDRYSSLLDLNIDVLDMECSALFSASKATGLKAFSMFWISDIITTSPYYRALDPSATGKINNAIVSSFSLVEDFYNNM